MQISALDVEIIPPEKARHRANAVHRFEDQSPETQATLENIHFVILGAQKGGTTWLSDVIRKHEDAYIPVQKELHYFNVIDHYKNGPEWYASYFKDAGDKKILGEATPNYMWNYATPAEQNAPDTDIRLHDMAPNLKALLPNAKLLACLRDPVARTASAYYHLATRARFAPRTPIRDCADRFGLLTMSRYDLQMDYWFRHVSRDDLKVIIYEDEIKPDEAKMNTANEVFRFIGLPEKEEHPAIFKRSNDKEKPALAWLRQIPGIKPKPFDWTRAIKPGERIAQGINRRLPQTVQNMLDIKISQADRDMLQEYFEPHNRRLEELLERKLPW